jgi:hypothetical protein
VVKTETRPIAAALWQAINPTPKPAKNPVVGATKPGLNGQAEFEFVFRLLDGE